MENTYLKSETPKQPLDSIIKEERGQGLTILLPVGSLLYMYKIDLKINDIANTLVMKKQSMLTNGPRDIVQVRMVLNYLLRCVSKPTVIKKFGLLFFLI